MNVKRFLSAAAVLLGLSACGPDKLAEAPHHKAAVPTKAASVINGAGSAAAETEPSTVEIYTMNPKFAGARIWLTTSAGRSTGRLSRNIGKTEFGIAEGTRIEIADPGNMRGGYTVAVKATDGTFIRFAELTRTTNDGHVDLYLHVMGEKWSGYSYVPALMANGNSAFNDQYAFPEKMPYRPAQTDPDVRGVSTILTPYTPGIKQDKKPGLY